MLRSQGDKEWERRKADTAMKSEMEDALLMTRAYKDEVEALNATAATAGSGADMNHATLQALVPQLEAKNEHLSAILGAVDGVFNAAIQTVSAMEVQMRSELEAAVQQSESYKLELVEIKAALSASKADAEADEVTYKEQIQRIQATSGDEGQKALLDTIVGLMADKVHLSSSLGAALSISNWDKSANQPYFMMELV
jgi:hypothetical protein